VLAHRIDALVILVVPAVLALELRPCMEDRQAFHVIAEEIIVLAEADVAQHLLGALLGVRELQLALLHLVVKALHDRQRRFHLQHDRTLALLDERAAQAVQLPGDGGEAEHCGDCHKKSEAAGDRERHGHLASGTTRCLTAPAHRAARE
jgi:hypothetical protein